MAKPTLTGVAKVLMDAAWCAIADGLGERALHMDTSFEIPVLVSVDASGSLRSIVGGIYTDDNLAQFQRSVRAAYCC